MGYCFVIDQILSARQVTFPVHPRLILSTMPIAAMVIERLVPPALKKGSGKPVVGRMPTTTPILINAWVEISPITPAASKAPN